MKPGIMFNRRCQIDNENEDKKKIKVGISFLEHDEFAQFDWYQGETFLNGYYRICEDQLYTAVLHDRGAIVFEFFLDELEFKKEIILEYQRHKRKNPPINYELPCGKHFTLHIPYTSCHKNIIKEIIEITN